MLPGFYHDTLGEKDRAVALAKVRAFLLDLFARAPERVDVTHADRRASRRTKPTRWRDRCPPRPPRGLYWRMTRATLRFGGTLSDGLRLGHETGFDSGSMLDYVYRNKASGRTPLGRLIDRNYLDSIGWRGIRQRKLLRRGAAARRDAPAARARRSGAHRRHRRRPRPLRAGGAGGSTERPDSILLRDYSDVNVRDGTALIAAMSLGSIARFVNADAFDRASLAAIEPRPTIGIVSGLYELFPDNDDGRHARSRASPTRCRRAASSSTPASRGIRSSN